MTADPVARLRDVIAFLLGEAPLDGRWYGDEPPRGEGHIAGYGAPYWWRKPLREAASALRSSGEAVAWVAVYADGSTYGNPIMGTPTPYMVEWNAQQNHPLRPLIFGDAPPAPAAEQGKCDHDEAEVCPRCELRWWSLTERPKSGQPDARGVEGMVLVPRELLADVEEQLVDLFNEKSANRGIYREREKLHDADVLQKVRLLLAATPNPVRAEQPEGKWKLVPVEPTGEMVQAAHEESHCGNGSDHIREVYAAMLAAAPAAPGAAVGVDEGMVERAHVTYMATTTKPFKEALHAILTAALAGKDGA